MKKATVLVLAVLMVLVFTVAAGAWVTVPSGTKIVKPTCTVVIENLLGFEWYGDASFTITDQMIRDGIASPGSPMYGIGKFEGQGNWKLEYYTTSNFSGSFSFHPNRIMRIQQRPRDGSAYTSWKTFTVGGWRFLKQGSGNPPSGVVHLGLVFPGTSGGTAIGISDIPAGTYKTKIKLLLTSLP